MGKLYWLTFLFLVSSTALAQRYDWIKVYSPSSFASTVNHKIVSKGNHVYVAGEFTSSISFGTIVLTAQPGATGRDLYVAKYDTLGNVIWAINGGSTNTNFDSFRGLTVDSSGNVYVAGIFSQNCTWGPVTVNGFYSSTPSSREGFITKINSNGDPQWIRTFHNLSSTFLSFNTLRTLDAKGGVVYLAGELFQNIGFNGSSVTALSPLPNQTENLWIARIDTSGNVIDAEVPIFEANTGFNSFFYFDFEAINETEFVVSGEFNGSLTFGTNTLSTGSTSMFVARFKNPDTTDWVITSTSGNVNTCQIKLGPNNEVRMGGSYFTSLSIGGKTITAPSFTNWFVGSVSPTGTVEILKNININSFSLTDLTINDKFETYLTGSFSDSVEVNGMKKYSFGSNDMVVLKLDSVLDPIWVQTGGGGNSDGGMSLTPTPGGDVIALVNYRGLAQFGSTVLTGSGTFNPTFLVTKLSNCGDYDVPLTFLGDTSFCQGGSVRIVTPSTGLATFQWLKDSILLAGEVFRDILVTQQGNYQVIVNGSGCIDTSRNVLVSVGTPPIVSLNPLDSACQSDTMFALSGGSPSGGTWTGIGVTDSFFNASVAGIGNTAITYTFNNNGCRDSATTNLYVEPSPVVFFAPLNNICETAPSLTLTNAFPPGGDFFGSGVNGGLFYPDSAGVGTHKITYVYTSSNGCSNFADQNIQVDSPDTLEFDSLPTLCQFDAPYELVEGYPTGGNYFGPGVSSNSFDPLAAGPGIHVIGYAIDNDCGIDTGYAPIEVLPSPVVSINPIPNFCEGSVPLILSPFGSPLGGTYSGSGVSGSAFFPDSSGVGDHLIFYDFIDANGCGSQDSTVIRVNPNPIVTLSNDTAICFGDSVQINASGGVNYSWSNGSGSSAQWVDPSFNQSYTVLVTDSNGCSSSDSLEVLVNALPMVQITGNDTLCFGDSTLLSASGANSYVWSTGDSSGSITLTPITSETVILSGTDLSGCQNVDSVFLLVNSLPVVSLGNLGPICIDQGALTLNTGSPAGGVYNGVSVLGNQFDPSVSGAGQFSITYSFTDINGCSDFDTTSLQVNPLPVISLTADTSICLGDSLFLSAGGGNSYSWSNGSSGPSNLVSPLNTTTYRVMVTDSNSCSDSDSVEVVVNSLPIVQINGIDTICFGDSTVLTAVGAQSYSWSNGSFDPSTVVSPGLTTSLQVSGIDLNGCRSTDQITVVVNALPVVSFGSISDLCQDSPSIPLNNASPAGGNYLGPGVSSNSFDPQLTGSGTFGLVYTFSDANGCTNSDSGQITVNPLPVIILSSDTQICNGDSIPLIASGGSSYSWNTGAIGSQILVSPLVTTNYSVLVTDSNSCSNQDSLVVSVLSLPTVTIVGVDTICQGNPLVLTASGAQDYLWSNSDTSNPATFFPLVSSSISVIGSDQNGCSNSDSFNVIVNTAPNVSIPNFGNLCYDASPISLGGASPSGGVYSGTGVLSGSFDPQVSGIGTFYVLYSWSDSIGCFGFDSTAVEVFGPPQFAISNDTSICIGDSINLQVMGGSSYLWNTGDNSSTITVSPTQDSVFTVIVSDSNNCSLSDSVAVSVLDFPTLSISTDTSVCPGDSLILVANSNTGNYFWFNGSANDSVNITPTSTGYYWVLSTNQGFCGVEDSVLVTLFNAPSVNIGPDSVYLDDCVDSIYVFSPGPGYSSYVWQNTSSDSTFTVNFIPLLVGFPDLITLVVTDSNGCQATDSSLVIHQFCTPLNSSFSKGQIKVYPNPFEETIKLEFQDLRSKLLEIEIVDLLGKSKYRRSLTAENLDLELGFLSSGTYQLIIKSKDKRAVFQLIKR